MLLPFQSQRGQILNLFAKIRERINCWERLARVGTIRRESRREEQAEVLSRKKKIEGKIEGTIEGKIEGTKRAEEGGEEAAIMCDPGSELRLYEGGRTGGGR